jgi:outer membrane protein TolC
MRRIFRLLAAGVVLAVATSAIQHDAVAQAPAQREAPGPPSTSTPGKELTLEEAIAIALQRQPQILSRIDAVVAAQARVDQALAPLLPQSAISWAATRSEAFSSTTRSSSFSTSSTLQITLSQKLFDFGKNFATIDARKADAEFSKADLELQRDLIVLSVKTSYFTLLFSKRLVNVNQQALDRAELNLRSARGFFEVGTRPKSDVTRAEVDVANARVTVIQTRNAVRLARVALNTTMAIEVDAPTEVKDILTYEPFPIEPKLLAQEALKSRPEYMKVKAQEVSAEATLKEKFRQFFPDLTGSGSYGGTGSESGTTSATVFPFGEIWSLGVTLQWSWFDGLGNVAKYREAKANLDSARSNTRSQELLIRQDVEQAYLALGEAEERIGAAQKGVESAQENFRLAQGRFDAGVGTIIELTDAQLALTQAQSTEAQALKDFRIGKATLEKALGRR